MISMDISKSSMFSCTMNSSRSSKRIAIQAMVAKYRGKYRDIIKDMFHYLVTSQLINRKKKLLLTETQQHEFEIYLIGDGG